MAKPVEIRSLKQPPNPRHLDDPDKFTIICGEKQWEVHKNIVRAHSNYLASLGDSDSNVSGLQRKMVAIAFQLTSRQEGNQDVIDLSAEQEHLVAATVRYLRHGDWEDRMKCSTNPQNTRVHFAVLAKRYDIDKLYQLTIYDVAFRAHQSWSWNIDWFPLMVKAIYTETPESAEELRLAVIDVAWQHESVLFDTDDANFELFRKVVRETPAFKADLDDAIMRYGRAAGEFRCATCREYIQITDRKSGHDSRGGCPMQRMNAEIAAAVGLDEG